MGRPMNNSWRHPSSSFESKEIHGKITFFGILWVDGVEFRFRIVQQKNSRYAGRGHINLISPTDTRIMQLTGTERRERIKRMKEEKQEQVRACKRSEALNASASVTLSRMDKALAQEKLEAAARKLLLQCCFSLEEATAALAATGEVSYMRLVKQHTEGFLGRFYKGVAKRTQARHRRTLEKSCGLLGRLPMDGIRKPDIGRLVKELGAQPRPQLRLLSMFWEFCREKGFCKGENPFSAYLEHMGKPKKDVSRLQKKALESPALPETVERRLDELIATKISDGRYMGVVLAKEAYIASKLASTLKWRDIIFMGDGYVRVVRRRDELVGATHDFTRPILPYGGQVLAARYAWLRKDYTEEQLRDMPVVSTCKNPAKALKPKDITTFCHTALLQAGMNNNALMPNRNEKNGAGTNALRKHCRHRMEHECGIASDNAALQFLMGKSLHGDVTADHYRSFTCPEGQWQLYRLLCRDPRRLPDSAPAENAASDEPGSNGWRCTVADGKPGKLTSVSFKVLLKKGQRLELFAAAGLEGSIKAVPAGGSDV